MPSTWPTTSERSSATTPSTCSRRGRRCPSSASARASRPWDADSASCGDSAIRSGCRGSWWPRCGRSCSASAPTSRTSSRSPSGPVTSSTRPSSSSASSPTATAASTRSSIAARSRCEVRSSTCSRAPPTRPFASTCGATRSTASPSSPSPTSARPTTSPCAEIFGCRELLPTDEVRERAASLVAREPWGREQWERLAEGQTFEGMESWLPWLTADEHVILDLVGRRTRRSCSSSPAACATAPASSSTRRPASPRRWRRRGASIRTASSRASTSRSTDCSATPTRRRGR